MMKRWVVARPKLKIYTMGFMSGALLVYTMAQFANLSLMDRTNQQGMVKIKYENNPRSLLKKIVRDYATLENDDDRNIFEENIGDTSKLPGYLEEPIDAHEYNYIHNPEYMCFNKDGERLNIIVLFLSLTAPDHFDRRNAIRATYGNQSEWEALGKKRIMRTVFLLGATSNATLQRWIDSESYHHVDIIQEDFVDSYMNLTRKTVMGLKWMTNHCRHARYAMKIDDDTMMNQRRFRDIVLKNASLTNFTAGKALIGTPSVRKKSSKFYLSEEYFPSPTFPPYMDGPAYLLSLDLVEDAYKQALTTPLFKWEDAFLGMCLEKAGAEIQGIERFLLFKLPTPRNETDLYLREKRAKSYIFVSNLSPGEMKWMWNLCHV